MKKLVFFILIIIGIIIAAEWNWGLAPNNTPAKTDYIMLINQNKDSVAAVPVGRLMRDNGIMDSTVWADSIAAFLGRGLITFTGDIKISGNDLTYGNGASVTNPSSGILSLNSTILSVPTDSAYIANVLRTDTTHTKKIIYDADQIRVLLPDTLSAVVDDTLQVYYRGIIEAVNPYAYHITVSGTKGMMYARFFEYAAVAADTVVNNYQTIFRVYDNQYQLLAVDTTIIKVQKAWQPATMNVLPLGDSFTYAGTWSDEFYRRLTGTGGTPAGKAFTGLTFVGNLGTAPNQRIGYGGKNWFFYATKTAAATSLEYQFFDTHDKDGTDVNSIWSDGTNQWTLNSSVAGKIKLTKRSHTVDPPASGTLTHVSGATHTSDITYTAIEAIIGNPLWDYATETLSFTAYCTRNGIADIDCMATIMTWNDIGTNQPNIADHIYSMAYAKVVLDKLHAEYPTAKVIWGCPQMPPAFSGLGLEYAMTTDYGYYYGKVRSVFGYSLAAKYLISSNNYDSWVYYCPTMQGFDNEYSYTAITKKPNYRYPYTLREDVQTGGIHPNAYGYYQMADVVYREFVRLYCK